MAYSPHFGTAWYTLGTALVHPETSKKINGTRLWYTWYTLWKACRGVAQENVASLGPSVGEQAKSGKESEAIGTQPKLSAAIRTLNSFYSACWWSSQRKILSYENLQQPTTTYYSLKICLAPDLCVTRSRPIQSIPDQSRPKT